MATTVRLANVTGAYRADQIPPSVDCSSPVVTTGAT
jgi:hypothetical protein